MQKSTSLLSAFFVLLLLLGFHKTQAAHITSGEIFYRWSPIPSDSSRYEVFVHYLRNNYGPNIGGSSIGVCISSSCFNDINITLNQIMPPAGFASPNDNQGGWIVEDPDCADKNDPYFRDLSIYKFSGFVSIPGRCHDIRFSSSAVCCRDVADNLTGTPNLFLEAQLNNTLGESSSPQIMSSPGISLCVQPPGATPSVFAQSAIDPDGDSIRYVLAPAKQGLSCGPSTNCSYQAGFTALQPIPSHIGWNVNQKNGVFTISPSQQGNYVTNFVVENYRFNPQTYSWDKIGTSSRDVIVNVVANCQYAFNDEIIFSLAEGSGQFGTFTGAEIDSLKSAFGASNIHLKPNGKARLSILDNYECFDKILKIDFDQPIRRNSITATDFRIFTEDSSTVPIVAVYDSSSTIIDVESVYLQLHQPLLKNGNYLLQIKTGHDGNTLIGKCGGSVPEFSSALIEVRNCPAPEYRLNQVTLKDDYNLMVHWTAGPLLSDSSVYQVFNAWQIYARQNQGSWYLLDQIQQPLARRYEVDFGGSTYEVDHNQYEFKVALVYGGTQWESTRACNNILIDSLSVQHTISEDIIQLSWNPYSCIDAQDRDYYVQYGRYLGDIHINWATPIVTKNHQAQIRLPKTLGTGTYAIRVYARAKQVKELPSESNWLMHNLNLNPNNTGNSQTAWVVPNILTPNGDGQNDRFVILIPPQDAAVQTIRLRIYNRRGNLVFEDLDYLPDNTAQRAWDGTDQNGASLANGTYFYILEYIDPNSGSTKTLRGSINLRR